MVPDLSGANLHRANLSGANLFETNLSGVDLSEAELSGANFTGADLGLADLRSADLGGANLIWADLSGADLSEAKLIDADLSLAALNGAKFREANLSGANLSLADLPDADFSNAMVSDTIFANDLSRVKGLGTVKYFGSSIIGIDTIYLSKGNIPIEFLRGAGVPDNFIEYMHSLVGTAFEFYSCFISYSTKDQEFADRLYTDLQANGVRCWFAPHHVQAGKKLHAARAD